MDFWSIKGGSEITGAAWGRYMLRHAIQLGTTDKMPTILFGYLTSPTMTVQERIISFISFLSPSLTRHYQCLFATLEEFINKVRVYLRD